MSGNSVLTGSLKFISLADIFQILGGNSSTGRLAVRSQYAPNPGLIYFSNGNPINAAVGSLNGIDALYSLFGWVEGTFEFYNEDVGMSQAIKQGRMEIVLDALRMLDDGEIERVGPPSFEADAAAGSGGAGHDGKPALPVVKGPLVDYSYILEEETYRDGQKIVAEGKHGKWMWVVFEGTVRVTREMDDGPFTIAMLGEGSFVGTFEALLFGEYTRTASVTAVGDARLCLLDTERLFRAYSSLSPDFKNLLLTLNGRLHKVSDRVIELSTKEKKNNSLSKDKDVIIEKGSSKEQLFKITDGNAYVVGHARKGVFPILTLEKNDIFGYVPFVDMGHEPQSATIMASKDLKVDNLDITGLQKEYDGLSTTFRNLIFNVATCVSVTTRFVYQLYERN